MVDKEFNHPQEIEIETSYGVKYIFQDELANFLEYLKIETFRYFYINCFLCNSHMRILKFHIKEKLRPSKYEKVDR
jgi:hypothetical protein